MSRLKLGLGTAQFGMDYGVSNRQGKTSPQEVGRILAYAAEHGVRVIDTAAVYGDSEEVLGGMLPGWHSFDLVTKLPSLLGEDDRFDEAAAERMLAQSLARLRQSSVYGLLLHRAEDLQSPSGDGIMDWLLRCRQEGQVQKVGVSVYAEDDVDDLLSRYPLQLIQAPVNVFDQRLVRSGALRRCKERGLEVHARSVFLQGLLLMDAEELPAYFHPYVDRIVGFHRYIRLHGLAPLEAALAYVNELDEVDAFVCGVNDCAQLLQLVSAVLGQSRRLDFASFASSDPGLVNPARWQRQAEPHGNNHHNYSEIR